MSFKEQGGSLKNLTRGYAGQSAAATFPSHEGTPSAPGETHADLKIRRGASPITELSVQAADGSGFLFLSLFQPAEDKEKAKPLASRRGTEGSRQPALPSPSSPQQHALTPRLCALAERGAGRPEWFAGGPIALRRVTYPLQRLSTRVASAKSGVVAGGRDRGWRLLGPSGQRPGRRPTRQKPAPRTKQGEHT